MYQSHFRILTKPEAVTRSLSSDNETKPEPDKMPKLPYPVLIIARSVTGSILWICFWQSQTQQHTEFDSFSGSQYGNIQILFSFANSRFHNLQTWQNPDLDRSPTDPDQGPVSKDPVLDPFRHYSGGPTSAGGCPPRSPP